ncbi:putative reverse transcriptase domain-containing protein, partial [Tanacetum coccineum]
YYRHFIANLSKIAKPLTELTQKNQKYEWGVEQEEAFYTLKDNLCNAPILSFPDGSEDFVVYCDASNQGLGCVLMQKGMKELNIRQRRWIELFSDYDYEIHYHPGKANVVADALSRKEKVKPRRVCAMSMNIQSSVKDRILAAQGKASKVETTTSKILCGLDQQMEKKEDGGMYFMDRIWVPLIGDVRKMIIDEAHAMRYFIHPGADKMYHDLRNMYWWPGMKRDIATYISKCLTCLKVKAEHQRPLSLLQELKIIEWKWDRITMDFITKLPRSSSGHDIIWAIVDNLTKSAHFLAIQEDYKMEKFSRLYIDKILARHRVPVSIISDRDGRFTLQFCERTIQTLEDMLRAKIKESQLIRLVLVQETTDKVVLIKERLKAARDRQKSYAANELRFRKKGKLAPSKKCLVDANLNVPLEEIKVDKTLRFVEEPVEIIDRELKKLKRSRIPIIKVHWNSKHGSEFTWE